jgi:hypothetical protein
MIDCFCLELSDVCRDASHVTTPNRSTVVTVAFVPSEPSLFDEVVCNLIGNKDSSYSPKFLSFCVSLALSPLHITPRTVVMLEIANRESEEQMSDTGVRELHDAFRSNCIPLQLL